MARILQRFLKDKTGATAIEYGLIAALIAVAIVAGVGNAADALGELWNGNNSRLADAFR